MVVIHFFFQAEDGIRDLVRSRGLGDVYKRQEPTDIALGNEVVTYISGAKLFKDMVAAIRTTKDLSLIHI